MIDLLPMVAWALLAGWLACDLWRGRKANRPMSPCEEVVFRGVLQIRHIERFTPDCDVISSGALLIQGEKFSVTVRRKHDA